MRTRSTVSLVLEWEGFKGSGLYCNILNEKRDKILTAEADDRYDREGLGGNTKYKGAKAWQVTKDSRFLASERCCKQIQIMFPAKSGLYLGFSCDECKICQDWRNTI